MPLDASLACPCGHLDYAVIHRGVSHRNVPDYHYELHACTRCTLVRTLPVPRQDVYAHGDEATAARIENEASYRGFARAIVKACQRHVTSGAMLDVGCNIGLLVAEAQAAGFDAWGLDLDPEAVAHGRAQGRNLTCGTLEAFAATGRQFQLITLNHVLEHVADIGPFLQAIDALLAPGGIVMINVPNYAGWVPKVMKDNWGALWPHQHVWQFTPRTLVETVERATGLQRVSLSTTTNLEPPSTRDLKGLLKQGVISASTLAGHGDEIRSVFRKAASGPAA